MKFKRQKMKLDDIGTQLLFCTVPLLVEKEKERHTGTGFLFNFSISENESIPLLITNLHLVENAKKVWVEFHGSTNSSPDKTKRIRVEIDGDFISQYTPFSKNFNEDIFAFPIAGILDQVIKQKGEIFFKSITQSFCLKKTELENCAAIETVTIIGYPKGICDPENWLPIVRQGITATPVWNNFNGKSSFLIDAGIFPGSSGSPVFLYNQGSYSTNTGITIGTRLAFIGIVAETYIDKADSNTYLGLGKVINSDKVLEFVKSLMNQIQSKQSLPPLIQSAN